MRYFIELSYHGKNYHGWQIQPDVKTVQETLQKAVCKITQENTTIVGAGRTDTGVHALQMFAHFDIEKEIDAHFAYRLNAILPNDIVVKEVCKVAPEKHARFDAVKRSYEYRIWLGRNPFLLEVSSQIHHQKIDVDAMNKATKLLLEYTNFECFSKVKTEVHTFNCTITNAVWKQEKNKLTFYISANRFLRNMVRAIVGTLLEVGTGKITQDDFKKVIESKNRSNAGLSVPAKGLFLTEIIY